MSVNHHPPNLRKSIKNATKRVSTPGTQVGDWILEQDEYGNLIARHQETQNRVVLAIVPNRTEGG